MAIKYQIILIGDKSPLIEDIHDVLFRHITELGLIKESVIFIEKSTFLEEYKANAPTFCLYFGNNTGSFKDLDILDRLLKMLLLSACGR